MGHMFYMILVVQLFTLTGATESGIIRGKESKPHSRPYMASLQFGNYHSCGGILICKDFVLTAAHCNQSNQEMTVVLGAHNRTKKEKSQQKLQVAKYYLHPKYNGIDYDIMLLKLKKSATLNKYVKPIDLPKKNEELPANVKCEVAGWGQTGHNKPTSHVLREATVILQFNHECKYIWKQHFSKKNMLCTKFNKKAGGICEGDSGGPLICNSEPQGVAAFTANSTQMCEDPRYPHVFIKIQSFLDWIKTTMQK